MTNILYIDAFHGLAGDMLLGGLVDLGVNAEWLKSELGRLDLGQIEIEFPSIADRGLSGHGLKLTASHDVHFRHLPEISEIIKKANFSPSVTQNSLAAFQKLAVAEAEVHGLSPNQVHFHEVGAHDTIIDIVGFFLALEYLQISKVICSPLPMPNGRLTMSHGLYPLPAPAVPYLLAGFHTYGVDEDVELVTPTGAAIVASCAQPAAKWPQLIIDKVGFGAGTPGRGTMPNMVRLVKGRSPQNDDHVWVIEAEIDDINPEFLAYTGERLLAEGALDYYITSVYMKKSRPGFLLTVLGDEASRDKLCNLIFSETTTLGLRFYPVFRSILSRNSKIVSTPFGPISVKIAALAGGNEHFAPEYNDCAEAARRHGVPLKSVYQAALMSALNNERHD